MYISFTKLSRKMRKGVIIITAVLAPFLISLVPSSHFISDSAAATKKPTKIAFNFNDVELAVVTKFVSEVTGKNFIFDEKVKGKITIMTPSRLSPEDAFNLFTSILELKGFTVVPSGIDAYKIVPTSEAKQKGIDIAGESRLVNESYIARLISLKAISAADTLKLVQPVVSKDGYISSFGPGNLLLVIDSGLNIEKILSIIELIDQPSLKEAPEIIFLKHSSAEAISKVINEGLGLDRQRAGQTQLLPHEETKVVADPRLNAVIIFGGMSARESIKS
ncbi:MAG: type II secretion system protein GspD, partial [Nitrospirae bacterium]|nr:type II secretion system protein GspD [Nitrospirota bacterium]